MKASLGTQLRHLIELLDGAVQAAYLNAGLDYRPRYTPVMRALMAREPATIGHIAESAGISQPATTQTIALMIREGLLLAETGARDGRQRLIRLSPRGKALLPQLQLCWQATAGAAASLEQDLPFPLSELLGQAIAALEHQSYGARIRSAREALEQRDTLQE
jgi:DNA-binding MarR family transcriptional regulator